jgi:hypothetical protein
MKLAKGILLLSACALIAGCNKGGNTNNASATGNTSGTATTSASASPKATTETSKSPSEAAQTAGKVSKPEDAAQGLFSAWKTKDRTAAARYATTEAITMLYSEGSPEGLQFQGCDKQDNGNYMCGYSYEGGGLIMTVTGTEGNGYKVVSTQFIAD